jgi:hypothetical protein
VAMSDRKNGEPPSEFMSHVAAMSWAATRQPETRLAIDSCINIKTRFLNTNHTDVLSCCSVATPSSFVGHHRPSTKWLLPGSCGTCRILAEKRCALLTLKERCGTEWEPYPPSGEIPERKWLGASARRAATSCRSPSLVNQFPGPRYSQGCAVSILRSIESAIALYPSSCGWR